MQKDDTMVSDDSQDDTTHSQSWSNEAGSKKSLDAGDGSLPKTDKKWKMKYFDSNNHDKNNCNGTKLCNHNNTNNNNTDNNSNSYINRNSNSTNDKRDTINKIVWRNANNKTNNSNNHINRYYGFNPRLTTNFNRNNNNNNNNNRKNRKNSNKNIFYTNPNNNNNNNNNNSNCKIEIHNTAFDIPIPQPPERHISKSLVTVFAGGFAGMISKTCTAPLERVQMLNQTGATQASIMQTLNKIFSEDGMIGLWRGNLANCLRVFPHKSILFTVNDIFRDKFSHLLHNDSTYLNFVTGAAAGAVATSATYPIDFIRAYLAGTFDKESRSMLYVAKKVVKKQGIGGLYTGLGVTLAGAVPYEAVRIGVYNVLRGYIPTVPTNFGDEPHPVGKLFVGACAGATAGVVTYPTDTLRRMLQVQQANGMPVYSGVYDCISTNLKQSGVSRFYRGITAKLVRVIPDAAILFMTYEMIKNYLEDVHYDFSKTRK